jgi:hypothetical protein
MDDWWYYSRLPPLLRHALAGAAFDYRSDQFYFALQSGIPLDHMIRHVRECDLQHALADQVSKVGSREYRQRSPTAVTKVRPLYT